MKNSKRALENIELKSMWDRYQSNYTKYISKNFLPVYLNMYNLLKIEGYENPVILDMGCGSGHGIKLIRDVLDKKHIIYGTDLSTNMLNYSYSHLAASVNNLNITELNLSNNTLNKLRIDTENDLSLLSNSQNSNYKKSIVRLYEMNNEDLRFKDDSFNSIISNFSLNIVNDYNKMIDESYRVIKKDGSACFSIWGRPENSFPFTVIPKVLKKFKIPLPEIRSFFHLSKEDYLRQIFSRFKEVYIGYSLLNLNIFSFEDFRFMIESPVYADIFENIIDQEPKLSIIKEIKEEIEGCFKDNMFLNTEIMIIKAVK